MTERTAVQIKLNPVDRAIQQFSYPCFMVGTEISTERMRKSETPVAKMLQRISTFELVMNFTEQLGHTEMGMQISPEDLLHNL